MDFLPGISNALAQFSYKTALNFFGEITKNSFFSPYSLFLALFLSSAINPDISPRILKHLNFPNTEIPSSDQIKQLQYFSKSVETVPSIKKNINSTSFNQFISKYKLTEDQKYISYLILNRMIKKINFDGSLSKEAKIESFLKKVDETDSTESLLSQKAQKYKRFIEEDVKKYPLIIGSNYLFLNKKVNFSMPRSILSSFKKNIYETNFPDPGYKVINKFIENSTRGLISDFISSSDLPASSLYFIANTIYFKGIWKNAFKLLSEKKKFNTIENKEEKIDFLSGKGNFNFHETDDLVYVDLEYYKCSFSLEVIMAKNIEKFRSIRTELFENQLLEKISKEASPTKLLLTMPKFTLKTELMNFDKILKIGGIDSVFQKAVIIVDEKGTEAAAASGIVSRSINLDPPKEINIDHPFVFIIRDVERNIPLFIGEFVNSPNKNIILEEI